MTTRTDTIALEVLRGTIDRCNAYVEAGADMIFLETITRLRMHYEVKTAIEISIFENSTKFGYTPLLTREELFFYDVEIILYRCLAYRVMNKVTVKVFKAIRKRDSKTFTRYHTNLRSNYTIIWIIKHLKIN